MRITDTENDNKPSLEEIIWWSLLSIPSAIIIGCIVAILLWGVEQCFSLRLTYPLLAFLLPIAGLLIFFFFKIARDHMTDGFALDKIQQDNAGVTEKAALPVFLGTIFTHLCSSFPGREGASLQIGASISQAFASLCKIKDSSYRMVISSGIAAAFSAVFGAPLTGAVFALEVARRKHFHAAFAPSIISSIIGYEVSDLFGIHTSQWAYVSRAFINPAIHQPAELQPLLLIKITGISILAGLACCVFAIMARWIKLLADEYPSWLAPVFGGIIVVALTWFIPLSEYITPTIPGAHANPTGISMLFNTGNVQPLTWLWIMIITALLLANGFYGGEITPLMLSGAALGNTVAQFFHLPPEFAALIGLVAMFAAATNTPLAATLLGVELFGSQYIVHFMLVSLIAYFLSPAHSAGPYKEEYWPKLLSKNYNNTTVLDAKEKQHH